MSVKKFTMQDFEEQRAKQEEELKKLDQYNYASFSNLNAEIQEARPNITKKASAVESSMPLTTELPVTNQSSAANIDANHSLVQVKKPRSRSGRARDTEIPQRVFNTSHSRN